MDTQNFILKINELQNHIRISYFDNTDIFKENFIKLCEFCVDVGIAEKKQGKDLIVNKQDVSVFYGSDSFNDTMNRYYYRFEGNYDYEVGYAGFLCARNIIGYIIDGVDDLQINKSEIYLLINSIIMLINKIFPGNPLPDDERNEYQKIDYNCNFGKNHFLYIQDSIECRRYLYLMCARKLVSKGYYDIYVNLLTKYDAYLSHGKREIISLIANDTNNIEYLKKCDIESLKHLYFAAEEVDKSTDPNLFKEYIPTYCSEFSKWGVKVISHIKDNIKNIAIRVNIYFGEDETEIISNLKDLILFYDKEQNISDLKNLQHLKSVEDLDKLKAHCDRFKFLDDICKIILKNDNELLQSFSLFKMEFPRLFRTFAPDNDSISKNNLIFTSNNIKKLLQNINTIYGEQIVDLSKFSEEELNGKEEEYVKNFFSWGIALCNVYNYSSMSVINFENIVNECYEKIKSNKDLIRQLASSELNSSMLFKIKNAFVGDYTSSVVCYIKGMERLLKEVLVQNFPKDIYDTKKNEYICIDGEDINKLTAESISHNAENSLCDEDYIAYCSLECGPVFKNLHYIYKHPSQVHTPCRIKSNNDFFKRAEVNKENYEKLYHHPYLDLLENTNDTNNRSCSYRNNNSTNWRQLGFYARWVSRVRNGYMHIDMVRTIEKVKEIKMETAYWMCLAIISLPSLKR